MNIIEVIPDRRSLSTPRKFYVNCPIDVEMFGPEVRKVEIPRELAKYMHGLQSRIAALEEENERLKKGTR